MNYIHLLIGAGIVGGLLGILSLFMDAYKEQKDKSEKDKEL